jgi:hypothetical protein
MVKVTGGGTSTGGRLRTFGYISRHGELEIETDEGERIPKEAQKEFLEDWHLELVKAEGERGGRLHIDKEMLREWREDFARMMREQGVPANATPRVARGRNKGTTKDPTYRAQAFAPKSDCCRRAVGLPWPARR